MPRPKIMSVEINEDTYPLAAACLPESFRTIHPSRVYGLILVINMHITVGGSGMPIENKIGNEVFSKAEFEAFFDRKNEVSVAFTEVDHRFSG